MTTDRELVEATSVQLGKWAEIIGGKAWGADKGKPRIYMPSRRDCKVYFAFENYPTGDDECLLGGATFRCCIDDCGQHPNWYAGQQRTMLERHYREALALEALAAGEEQFARDIMELDEIDADTLDDASDHLTNGRVAEARAAVFGA